MVIHTAFPVITMLPCGLSPLFFSSVCKYMHLDTFNYNQHTIKTQTKHIHASILHMAAYYFLVLQPSFCSTKWLDMGHKRQL